MALHIVEPDLREQLLDSLAITEPEDESFFDPAINLSVALEIAGMRIVKAAAIIAEDMTRELPLSPKTHAVRRAREAVRDAAKALAAFHARYEREHG